MNRCGLYVVVAVILVSLGEVISFRSIFHDIVSIQRNVMAEPSLRSYGRRNQGKLRMVNEVKPDDEEYLSDERIRQISSDDFLKSLSSKSVDEIIGELEDIPQTNLPPKVMEILSEKMSDNAPSQLEIVRDTLGITPFTIYLAIAAFGMFFANLILGDGWAANLLRMNPSNDPFVDSRLDNPINREKIAQMQLHNKINIDDAIQRFQILEKDPTAFDEEGDPNFDLQFQGSSIDDLKIPDFIHPEEEDGDQRKE